MHTGELFAGENPGTLRSPQGDRPWLLGSNPAGAQPAVHVRGSGGGKLSPESAERGGVAGGFPAGERADDQQRLGGTLRQAHISGTSAKPELRTGAGEGGGVSVAGRDGGDRLSGRKADVGRVGWRAVAVASSVGQRDGTALSGGGLRWALNAVPKADRRATLRPPPERKQFQSHQMQHYKKGTFLTS